MADDRKGPELNDNNKKPSKDEAAAAKKKRAMPNPSGKPQAHVSPRAVAAVNRKVETLNTMFTVLMLALMVVTVGSLVGAAYLYTQNQRLVSQMGVLVGEELSKRLDPSKAVRPVQEQIDTINTQLDQANRVVADLQVDVNINRKRIENTNAELDLIKSDMQQTNEQLRKDLTKLIGDMLNIGARVADLVDYVSKAQAARVTAPRSSRRVATTPRRSPAPPPATPQQLPDVETIAPPPEAAPESAPESAPGGGTMDQEGTRQEKNATPNKVVAEQRPPEEPPFIPAPEYREAFSGMREAGQFDMLVRWMQESGADRLMNAAGPFTFFAPTDGALQNLPPEVQSHLLSEEGKKKLMVLLAGQIVPGRITTADLKPGMPLPPSLIDTMPKISETEGQIFISNARISGEPIQAGSVTIYPMESFFKISAE